MRDYLYLWHEPDASRLVASGIEFGDVAGFFAGNDAGLVLLEHEFDGATVGPGGFDFVDAGQLEELAQDNIYAYGDFIWLDFNRLESADSSSEPGDEEIAQLAFFAHMRRPLASVVVPFFRNRFLAYSHDDGWRLSLYYANRTDLVGLLEPAITQSHPGTASQVLDFLRAGCGAIWATADEIERERGTTNINEVLHRRLA